MFVPLDLILYYPGNIGNFTYYYITVHVHSYVY